jgi:hypothetical protein
MENFLRFGGPIAAVVVLAAFAPSAIAQEKTTAWTCQGVGSGAPEPLGDREGHSIEVGQYSCRADSGPQAGSVGTGTDMWEWDGPKATLISSSGVARKPGSTSAWKFTEGEQTLTMTDGKVTGCTGSGRGKNVLATGGWASMAGTSFRCTWKCVGPASQFSAECTNE